MLIVSLLGLALAQDASETSPDGTTTDASATVEDAGAAEEELPDDFSEIVLVWPDKFARWRDTRWLIATELAIPTGIGLNARQNIGVQTSAFQVRAVVACDQDHKLGKKRLEVGCKIEDLALRASTVRRFGSQKDRERAQAVLDQIDADLTGAEVQLQVNERGAVTNIDLEGIEVRNDRERRRLETLRQICLRMFYPFHMKLPKSGVKEGNWPEFDSELMSMPSLDGIKGSSLISHWMNFYKGYLLVQDVGKGSVTVTQPLDAADGIGGSAQDDGSAGTAPEAGSQGGNQLGGGASQSGKSVGSRPSFSDHDRSNRAADQVEVRSVPDLNYRLDMTGVSIYNIESGIMEERVWNMVGTPSGANPSNMLYWYSGRIQLLGSMDEPELGPTEQINYPGQKNPDLPLWKPVDPEMEKDLERLMKGR